MQDFFAESGPFQNDDTDHPRQHQHSSGHTSLQPCAQRGVKFEHLSTRARATIAELGSRFIRNGAVVLLHGYSRVALAVLQRARQQVGLDHC